MGMWCGEARVAYFGRGGGDGQILKGGAAW